LCTLDAQSPLHAEGGVPRGRWERELTGCESEPSELIYFKVYKSQAPGQIMPQGTRADSAKVG